MTVQRDFLEKAPGVVGSTNDELLKLLAEQNDYLQDIANYMRRRNADVLTSAVVKGTSQLTNGITDANSHEVVFQVGSKPVEIYRLLAFSTWNHTLGLSILSLSNVSDGIPLIAGSVYNLDIATYSVFVSAPLATLVAPLVVNGPSPSAAVGGLFLYGYTIPDWDRIRNAIRS